MKKSTPASSSDKKAAENNTPGVRERVKNTPPLAAPTASKPIRQTPPTVSKEAETAPKIRRIDVPSSKAAARPSVKADAAPPVARPASPLPASPPPAPQTKPKFDAAKLQATWGNFSDSAKTLFSKMKQKAADSREKTVAKRKAAAEEAIAMREKENPSVPLSPFANTKAKQSAKRQTPTLEKSSPEAGEVNASLSNTRPKSNQKRPARVGMPSRDRVKSGQMRPQQRPAQSAHHFGSEDIIYQKPSNAQMSTPAEEKLHPVFGMTGAAGQSRPRSQKQVNRELSSLRNELKRHVKGKPSRPVHMMSVPAIVGRSIGRAIKITIFILVLTLLFAGGTGVGVLMGYINTTVPVDMALLKTGPLTSYMYNANGDLTSKYTGSSNIDRIDVSYDLVRHTYIDEAFIAIEDERFNTNIGIDPKRIGSAIVSALANGGTPTHGGSTITQQVVKLITGEDDVSAQRKIQEWYKAILLTQSLTKDEIMSIYLNHVPMGNSYVGIETAAQGYFGKSSSELSLMEAAYLAGIPRGPSLYNPRTESGLRNGLRRMRMVLGKMYQQGMISQSQYRESLNTELYFIEKPPVVSGTSVNSYYDEYALWQVITDYAKQEGLTYSEAANYITGKGCTIYSAQEPKVQSSMDRVANDPQYYNSAPWLYEDNPYKPELGQVIINNLTGTIAGMTGGVGQKKSNLLLNRAVDIAREPGSTIKPLAVYAPAIDMGTVTGATVFVDQKVYLDPQNPTQAWPQNLGGRFFGRVTVRNAVKWSLNIESAQVLNTIGPEAGKEYLNRVGIDRRSDGVGLAMAMGSFDKGLSPLEVAGGYAALATNGQYTRPLAYTKVLAHDGTVILEGKPEYSQAFKPETAFMMTTILRETLTGTNSSFGLPGTANDTIGLISNANGEDIYMVGKSGTTENRWDRWFSGYSVYYSTSVWYGLDLPQYLSEEATSYRAPEYVFRETMRDIHADLAPRDFEQPATVIKLNICNQSGYLSNPQCGNNRQDEYFVIDDPITPAKHCNIHGYSPPTPATTAAPAAAPEAAAPAPETPAAPAPAE